MRIEKAKVVSNERIASNIWRMKMASPGIAGEAAGPGQFISITVSESWELPLRRPMSIAGINDGQVEIIYKILGEGTKTLSRKSPGDSLNILGPLGNTFDLHDQQNSFAILVGGGVGIAPILWLHFMLNEKAIDHDLIIGAVTADEHFLNHAPDNHIFLTTDDGSKGEPGTVMPTLERLAGDHDNPTIFTCGPEPMLKAIHEFSLYNTFSCQMAIESYMACGTGVCQGCVIEMANNSAKKLSYHETYSLVCCEGPVYESRKVRF